VGKINDISESSVLNVNVKHFRNVV